MLLARQQ